MYTSSSSSPPPSLSSPMMHSRPSNGHHVGSSPPSLSSPPQKYQPTSSYSTTRTTATTTKTQSQSPPTIDTRRRPQDQQRQYYHQNNTTKTNTDTDTDTQYPSSVSSPKPISTPTNTHTNVHTTPTQTQTPTPTPTSPYTQKTPYEQIEALEQALKIQVEKRMDAEMKLKYNFADNNNNNNIIINNSSTSGNTITTGTSTSSIDKKMEVKSIMENLESNVYQLIQEMKQKPSSSSSPSSSPSDDDNTKEQIQEFSQLLKDFIHELDGLDGDESEEETICRKDILWFLNELSWRFNVIHDTICFTNNDSTGSGGSERKNGNENNDIIDYDILVSRLSSILDEQKTKIVHVINNDNAPTNDTNSNITNDTNDTNAILKEKEFIISTLEGRIAQLEEKIINAESNSITMNMNGHTNGQTNGSINDNAYTMNINGNDNSNGNQNHGHGNGHEVASSQYEYVALLEKYKHSETRYRNIIQEMQNSVNDKNQEIHKLRETMKGREEMMMQGLQSEINVEGEVEVEVSVVEKEKCYGTSMVNNDKDQSVQQYQQQQQHGHEYVHEQEQRQEQEQLHNQQQQQQEYSTLYNQLQVKSLMEDIEERNNVIHEMREEIDRLTQQKKKEPSHEADKVRLRYLQGIVNDLEHKLAQANGTKSRSAARYGSLAFWDIENINSIGSNLSNDDEDHHYHNNGGGLLDSTKGLDDQVKDISDCLRKSEEEKEILRKELENMKILMSQRNINGNGRLPV